MRHLKKLLAFALVLCLTAASAAAASGQDKAEAARLRLLEENKDLFGGLSAAQMQEDFDYLWRTTRENYPFLGVAERQGIDAEALYQQYRAGIAGLDGDIDFSNHVKRFVEEFKGLGHFQYFIDSGLFYAYQDAYRKMAEQYPQSHFKTLNERLSNPAAEESYKRLDALTQEINSLYGNSAGAEQQTRTTRSVQFKNVSTKILEEGKTAYIKIRSFGADFVEDDAKTLKDFYQKVSGYRNLIIDITGNGGGSDEYWRNNIVIPNIGAPATFSSYYLFAGTPDIREYLEADGIMQGAKPIAGLPEFPKIQKGDLRYLTHYVKEQLTLEPAGEQLFKGKLWVLIDEGVYSSSESFSMFCKNTGFATLVGTPTGGDGGGIDPLIFTMPNSGMAWRFSVLYTINGDGSNSEESGTTPDILCADGETPLEACLKQIA